MSARAPADNAVPEIHCKAVSVHECEKVKTYGQGMKIGEKSDNNPKDGFQLI